MHPSELVRINEIAGGPETAAHLLTFDSVHGRSTVSTSCSSADDAEELVEQELVLQVFALALLAPVDLEWVMTASVA